MWVVVLIAVVGIGFLLLFVIVMGGTKTQREEAMETKDAQLDALFDGRPQVMFSVTMVSLPADEVLAGAHERGYRLISDQKSTYGPRELVFEANA